MTGTDKRERESCIFRFKRYEPHSLAKVLAAHGWQLVAEFPHGLENGKPIQLLMLFLLVLVALVNLAHASNKQLPAPIAAHGQARWRPPFPPSLD